MSNCRVPNLILNESKTKKEREKHCNQILLYICLKKGSWKGLICFTLFTLWFLRHHLPCSRLGMGYGLRGCAGQSLVGGDASLRCQGCYWSNVFILLFNGWIGAFWELLKSRGGHSAARQGSLTSSAGRVPVWCICIINTRNCRSAKHDVDVAEGRRSVYTGVTTTPACHAWLWKRSGIGLLCYYTLPRYQTELSKKELQLPLYKSPPKLMSFFMFTDLLF